MTATPIANHVGYGLRNDEIPYAHKIPPGGNWRSLTVDEQRAFMKGSFGNGGGNAYQLRRMRWDEPAATITASIMGKATCQLHPNYDIPTEGANITKRPLLDDLPRLPKNDLTAIELFAGGGLMRLGVEHAGFTTVWANDFDKRACRAHEHNFGPYSIVCGDITQIPLTDIPDADVIIGGPPCQDFSVAGTGAGVDGERGKLVWRYLDIIAAKRPKAFLFENVKGLTTKRHRPTLDALIERFESIGYSVSWRVINAWDYGVAQKRERVFIVGIRSDLGRTYVWPKSEYETTGYRPVLRDAIGDLPEPYANHDPKPLTDGAWAYLQRDPRPMKKHRPPTVDEPSSTIVANLAKGVPYGMFYPDNHDGHLFDNVGNNPTWEHANRVAPLYPAAPTRTEKDRCDGLNPINGKPRRFTVRECLRIQSVPDSYTFPDDLSLSAMYRVVGNGVASRVAYHLAAALAEQLRG